MNNDNKKKLQEIINEIALATLEDAGSFNGYSAQDLFNATLIFQYFVMDLSWQYKQSKGLSIEESKKEIFRCGNQLRELLKEFCGLDMHEIAKGATR